jgi:hypothetical protein
MRDPKQAAPAEADKRPAEEAALAPADGDGEGGGEGEGQAGKRARVGSLGGSDFPFTPAGSLLAERWSAEAEALRKGGRPKEFVLPNFGFDKCQTLALRVS